MNENIDLTTSSGRGLEAALIRALPGLLPCLKVSSARRRPAEHPAGFVVEARTPTDRRLRLYVEVRRALSPAQVRERARQLKARVGGQSSCAVLASRFLSPRVREICREEQVGYVDLAGNCYLRLGDLYVERAVEKNPFPAQGRPASLFSPVSSRLLRALLSAPARAWQVQALARESGASLGQASSVCRRLIDEAYALRRDRRLRLAQPGRLLEAWRDAYAPRHRALAYYSFEPELDGRLAAVGRAGRSAGLRYAVTSLAAAHLVAPFVRGVTGLELYLGDELDVDAWVKALDLRPVESGANLILLLPDDPGVLYGRRTVQDVELVGDVQLYLDLWQDPGRGREQAEFLRKQQLGY